MIDNEHESLAVEIPKDVRPEDIVDPVNGWFKAEVSILRCEDCGEYKIGWRFRRAQRTDGTQSR